MPKLIVLYPPPADAAIFERRYRLEHAPMVLERIPGLKKFVAAQVLGSPAGTAPYQRVAELYFDSTESLQAGLASAAGEPGSAGGSAASLVLITFKDSGGVTPIIRRPSDRFGVSWTSNDLPSA